MKTTRIAAVVALAMIAAGNALAADIDITITGKVEDTTCRVNGARAVTRTVELSTVTTNALSAVGMTAGRKDEVFEITGCEAARTGVTLRFDSTNVNAAGRLTNTLTSGGAGNVEIQMLNGNTPVNLRTDAPTFTIASGVGRIPLGFQYYATAPATAGNVRSQLAITLEYK